MKRYLLMITTLMCMILCFSLVKSYSSEINIGELKNHLNQELSVKARTGFIKETNPNNIVFTIRDDYDNQTLVYSTNKKDLVMGVTYIIIGTPQIDKSGNIYLLESSRKRAFFVLQAWMIFGSIVLLVIIGYASYILFIKPKPAWGIARIIAGPDAKNEAIFLRKKRILVGRNQNDESSISFYLDNSVSKVHGEFTNEKGNLSYRDNNSTNGSFVNERPVDKGGKVNFTTPCSFRLGQASMIRIFLKGDTDVDNTIVGAPGTSTEDQTK